MKNVLLFGSSLSRDAISLDTEGKINLVAYYARSSWAAMSSIPHIEQDILDNIHSEFQRRVVSADMTKKFMSIIDSLEFDILLLDFIDERFNLLEFDNGAIHTLSAEYKRSLKTLGKKSVRTKVVKNGSEEYFEKWCKGFDRLIEILKSTAQLDKLRISKVFWTHNVGNQRYDGFDQEQINFSNEFLKKIYDYVSLKCGSQVFIRYPQELLYCSPEHKWGIEPFHYNDDCYIYTLDYLLCADDFAGENTILGLERLMSLLKNNQDRANRAKDYLTGQSLTLIGYPAVDFKYRYQWEADPFNNRTWKWQHNWFCVISDLIAYDITHSDDNALIAIFDMIDSWYDYYVVENPTSNFEFIWHDHCTALRVEQVILAIYYIYKYRNESTRDLFKFRIEKCLDLIKIHARKLERDDFYSKNTNHGLEQARVLLLISMFLKRSGKSQQWANIASSRIQSELKFSFTSEGVHVENSPGYHFFVFKTFLQIISDYKEEDLGSLATDFNIIAKKALVFLTHIIQPNGLLPIIGDTEEIKVSNPFGDYFKGTEEYDHFLYVITAGKKGVKPKEKIKIYQNSGYVIYRNGWAVDGDIKNDLQIIVKTSCLSNYHRQQDEGHFIINNLGRNWVVDSGMYNHNRTDPIRKYMRSRQAHNVLQLAGITPLSSVINPKPIRVIDDTEDIIKFSTPIELYAGVTITRTYTIDKIIGKLNIEDFISSSHACEVMIYTHFLENLVINEINDTINAYCDISETSLSVRTNCNLEFKKHFVGGERNGGVNSVISRKRNVFHSNLCLVIKVCVPEFSEMVFNSNFEFIKH